MLGANPNPHLSSWAGITTIKNRLEMKYYRTKNSSQTLVNEAVTARSGEKARSLIADVNLWKDGFFRGKI